ncbi:heavy metal-binding protein HIP-like [Mercenaria mercenaria]|uniref:heavy metal-binding protein HIP-like n=1 Tax=Mercenaria mercenaria TaxID=6596 RepID=UPI00234FB5A0|nr:heavy metal-binding protein HIP-like [Mercenaria mercenaria]
MNLLSKMILFLLLCALPCTAGQELHKKDSVSHILAELKNLQNAQKIYTNKLSELDEFKSRVLSLENSVKNLQDTVKDLQRENKELVSTLHRLETSNGQNKNVNDYESKTEGTVEETASDDNRDKSHNATFPLQKIFKESKKTNKHDQRIRQVTDAHIAFTAGLSAHLSLGDHHTVIYDQMFTNIGNAYHPHTGIFIAPYKGAYVFSTKMMLFPGEELYLEIVIDGSPVNYIYSDSTAASHYASATKEWILEVNKGSEVWIRSNGHGRLHGGLHCIFSAFLLFETQ